MAPRSIATATVSFGLVSIPVKLYTTSQPTEGISFRMLHGKCKTPLKQQYVCPTDGEKVERDDVVKGYEFAKDQFVLFSPDEIRALEEEATKAIAIDEFVPLPTVDPVYYDKAYYLGPDKGGERAYRLLARAMEETGLGGLARYAARGKQSIVLVRPVDGGLMMQQLRYAEEVRPFSEVPVGNGGEVKDAEMNLALQLLRQSASDEFHPEKYTDETLARFKEILQRKVEGEQTVIAQGEAPPAKVIDLMEALKASLAGGAAGAVAGAAPKIRGSRVAEGGGSADATDTEGAGQKARRGPARVAAKSQSGEHTAPKSRTRRSSS
jgi:DNA end-binding protein Ku